MSEYCCLECEIVHQEGRGFCKCECHNADFRAVKETMEKGAGK